MKSAGLFLLLKSTCFSWAEFVLSLKKSSKKLISGSTSASVRRKCEAEDSSPPRQKMYEWTDKDYTETSVLAPLQVDRNGPKIFILNTHLEREGSIAMTFYFFSLTN